MASKMNPGFMAMMAKKKGDDKAAPPAKKAAKGAMPKFAKGGAIDGVATKGKTKGTMVQMRGGK